MTQNNLTSALHLSADWDNAHGPIPVRMTNDYLFRALLQRNKRVLKALVCSLLHLYSNEVQSVTILNPIELGKTIDDKDFILDIKVELNKNTVINLEMQVLNEGNWPERSLSYLCRAFDNLNHGENYKDVRPVAQIGFLNYTLFEDSPEFYATYQLLNTRNHRLYSDKLRLCVVDLTKISLATKEDRQYEIDHWAALFKATTWEELKMLAKSNPVIEDAATTVYQLTQEEKIRQQIEAREDYYRRTAGREELLKETLAKKEHLEEEIRQLSSEKELLANEKEILVNQNEHLTDEIVRLKTLLAEHDINAE